ncbi:hypothetical protein AWV80_10190 [Cupriavidus sp. UYMU48A]|nr:hypothetical protein AWV80_10190 [Cupriavidus sp. UYMU48A]
MSDRMAIAAHQFIGRNDAAEIQAVPLFEEIVLEVEELPRQGFKQRLLACRGGDVRHGESLV